MKYLSILIILSSMINSGVNAQNRINIDSLKNEILNEVKVYVNQSNLESDKDIQELRNEIKQLLEVNTNVLSSDAVIELSNSAQREAVQASSEIIDGRLEKLLMEVEQMIKQVSSSLNNEIIQLINESDHNNIDEYEKLIHTSEEKMVRRITELIDNKYSEMHLIVTEKIEGENQNLIDKVNEQSDLISDLLKRVAELEKSIMEKD